MSAAPAAEVSALTPALGLSAAAAPCGNSDAFAQDNAQTTVYSVDAQLP
jgi:hypothetical protein